MRQITATEVTATNDLHQHNPGILALALASIQRRTTDPEIQALAADLIGVMAPDRFKDGTETPATLDDTKRAAFGIARRAVKRAAQRHAEEAAWLTSLDALTDGDTATTEALIQQSAERQPDLYTPETPRPDAALADTNRNRITAALTVVNPSRRATLTTAVVALADALDQHSTAVRLPTLASAAALALDMKKGRAYQRLNATIAAALADVAPHAAAIQRDPNNATTPTLPARQTATQTHALALPTPAPGSEFHPVTLVRHDGTTAPDAHGRTGGSALPGTTWTGALIPTTGTQHGTTTTPATTPGEAAAWTHYAGQARRQHQPTWTPVQEARRAMPWTETHATTDAAHKAAERLARLAFHEAHAADPKRAQASRTVRITRLDYDAALGYDRAQVIALDGTVLADHDATTWTPQHTALVLADLTDTSTAPEAQNARQHVASPSQVAAAQALPARPATGLDADREATGRAPLNQAGQVSSHKPVVSPRKKAGAQTGPTVAVRLTSTGTAWLA